MIRYGSVCSGIEAATAAWHPLGWEAAFFSEIEPFPRAVLAHHYPDVPLHGDFTTIQGDEYGTIDLLVGGTPCQSFSIAGLRGGLDDDRGNLALEFLRLADRKRPRWVVWENVPGVLSSNGGRDFGSILGGLVELGYGFAYRVLDAQYFGVAQRRRRVFVVGYLGDWRPAAAVLFERHSMSGHPAPSRQARQEAAGAAATGAGGSGSIGRERPSVNWPAEIACTLDTDFATKHGQNNQHVNAGCPLFVTAFASNMSHPDTQSDGTCPTIRVGSGGKSGNPPAVAFTQSGSHHAPDTKSYVAYSIMPMNSGKDFKARETEVAQPLMAGGPVGGNQGGDYVTQAVNDVPEIAGTMKACKDSGGWSNSVDHAAAGYMALVPAEIYQDSEFGVQAYDQAGTLRAGRIPAHQMTLQQSTVRRLTPVECERLQGFPDNFTAIPWRSKAPEDCPDGPRYKALGNSMAVPVMRWIGERFMNVEGLLND
jgi:DNA (cytosine-5)-methyltransferase 1